jgi:hypothetical protein
MAQCVLDWAHEEGHPRGADYLVGSQLFQGNCTRRFLRSMVSPTADNNRSSACWHRKFDLTVGAGWGLTSVDFGLQFAVLPGIAADPHASCLRLGPGVTENFSPGLGAPE